jgi:hypothetical protein
VKKIRIVWLDDQKCIGDFKFLNGKFLSVDSVDPDITEYEISLDDSETMNNLKFLSNFGMINIIGGVVEFETHEDILPCTRKVEKVKSNPMYLIIHFLDHEFILSETELLAPTKFRRCLLRIGKFINIPNKAWTQIVQSWLDTAIEIEEETEEEARVEKVLNYLSNCTIYEDITKAVTRNALFYDKEENGYVYCYIDGLLESINSGDKGNAITSRKLRAILSRYIDGNSIQRRVYATRYRFWKFKIEKAEIDIETQLYIDTEQEAFDERNNKDIGTPRDGQDQLPS